MITVELDRASKEQLKRDIERYAKKKGAIIEDSIDELAGHIGKALASKVQPFGLKVAKMKKFEKSIEKQVHRAIKAANVAGGSQSAASAHSSRRNNKGAVPRGLNVSGQYKRKPISTEDRFRLADLKASKAGMAKGSLLDAARKAWGGVKFPKYFNSKLNNGQAVKTGSGFKREVTLISTLGYIRKVVTDSQIRAAIKQGYKGMDRKIQKALDKK